MDDESSGTEDLELNLSAEDGWEDMERDEEEITVISLFDDKSFHSATEMLKFCKEQHNFDVWKIRNLEFIELVKLVNFVRSEVKAGRPPKDSLSKSDFEDDQYLKPVLPDDALLYGIEDVFDDEIDETNTGDQQVIESLRSDLVSTQVQFKAYRNQVEATLLANLEKEDTSHVSNQANKSNNSSKDTATGDTANPENQYDEDYFISYSYNSIHESMLKDTIRTDAYRDFIYMHKSLFAGKTVLDVGCGTGILSMFCAKAGAKLVIAVDNSDIIEKARENVFRNGFEGKIVCQRGKIEEVTLPVSQVDVIVSEWMGYCLLYESMLDSIIYARDKYLAPDGLMVPSHATIKIAPLADSDLRASHIDFWRDVYGFDMTSMIEKAHDEVLIRIVEKNELGAESDTIASFDIHKVRLQDLNVKSKFNFKWKEGFERLEGFVVWFDIVFATPKTDSALAGLLTTKRAQEKGLVAFSTGPESIDTHWQQGILLLENPSSKFSEGQLLEGEISFHKRSRHQRSLEIGVHWTTGKESMHIQKWVLE